MININEYLLSKSNNKLSDIDVKIGDMLYIKEDDHDWFWFFEVLDITPKEYKLQAIRPKIANREWFPSDERQKTYNGYIEDNVIKVYFTDKTYVLYPYTKDTHLKDRNFK
jgi:hypothetical protein